MGAIAYALGLAAMLSGLALIVVLIHDEVVEFINYMRK